MSYAADTAGATDSLGQPRQCRTSGFNLERDRRRYPRLHSKIYLPSNVGLLVAEIEDHAS